DVLFNATVKIDNKDITYVDLVSSKDAKLNVISSIKESSLFKLIKIVITCLYNFDHYFESHKIEVQLNLYNSMFYGTEEHWEDLVMNLLENATRYARTYVRIDLHKNSLSIFNDGDSIENIDSIFDPYQKGKNGKTGLGLSIVKSICTLYDYNILVKNKDGGVLFKIYREKENE
ncbi:MAG: HAMP domain-containing sensor histidine kinase, partial [Anaerorhabdus sp.]